MNQPTDLNSVQQAGRDAQFADDEINLFDLVKDVVNNLHWLVGITTLFAILGITYALKATPVYEVHSKIKPATEKYLAQFNAPELAGVYKLNAGNAYIQAVQALFSQAYRRDFYKSKVDILKGAGFYNESFSFSQNYQEFNKWLSLKESNDKKDAEKFLSISLKLSNPELVTSLLNSYVDYSLARRLQDINDDIQVKRLSRLKKLNYDADSLRDAYANNKTHRKLTLDEARSIAIAVGQVDPVYAKSDILGSFKPPLYMYGSKALEAEERAMENRGKLAEALPHGEEHFISGLPAILFDIKKLDDIKIDYSKLKLAVVDEPALEPLKPIKPKKLLIVILATIVGGFIGLMVALVLAAYKRYKTELK